MTKKIIDISESLVFEKARREIVEKFPFTGEDKIDTIIQTTMIHVFNEVARGLQEDEENFIYDTVIRVIEKFRPEKKLCYFCRDDVDPNDEAFMESTKLCMFCQLKVANILKAYGVDHKIMFPYMSERDHQPCLLKATK